MEVGTLGFASVAVATCSFHLCLGFWIGNCFAKARFRSVLSESNESFRRVLLMLDGPANGLKLLVARAKQVAGIHAVQPLRTPDIPRAANEMAELATYICERVQLAQRILQEKLIRDGGTLAGDDCGEPSDSLDPPAFDRYPADSRNADTSSFRTQRHACDALEFAAPFNGHNPAPSDFRPVRCRELSTEGLTFFSFERPEYESVVITLGTKPHLEFVLAHVDGVFASSDYDLRGYYVRCRFIERVKGVYRWDGEAGAIVAAKQEIFV